MSREAIKLTWEQINPDGRGRYRKMFKGRRFPSKVYASDSRRNQSDAWTLFLAWRDEVKAEIAAASQSALASDPVRLDTVEKIQVMRDIATDLKDQQGARFANKLLSILATVDHEGVSEIRRELELDDESDPLITVGRKLVEAKKEAEPENEYAASVLVDRYIATHKAKVLAKQKGGSIGLYGQTRCALKFFVDWFGAARGLDTLNKSDVIDYHAHLMGMHEAMSQTTLYAYHKLWRSFIKQVANDYDDIPIPKNLDDKRYVIRPENLKVVAFSIDECKSLLALASPRVKLWLLLMLNCGMYQGDISDLLGEEIDWDNGRIVRARSKEKNAPTINWLLWDETFELLKAQGNRAGTVLLKMDGNPLITEGIKADGNVWRRDAITSSWRHLVAKAKRHTVVADDWHKSLKQLRKTSSTLIERSPHAEFVDVFLDHSRVARRHYLVGQAVPKFDEAVIWLGNQLALKTRKLP